MTMTDTGSTKDNYINSPAVKEFETATFAMGCFWKPDALFGSLEGVIRTRVGYAGGSTSNPTYWHLADHIETVQLDYNPRNLSYQELLSFFFRHHNPLQEFWKRQYMSAVFIMMENRNSCCIRQKQILLASQAGEYIRLRTPTRSFTWLKTGIRNTNCNGNRSSWSSLVIGILDFQTLCIQRLQLV
ncbi:hypothetical protein DXT99_25070 [Pontibacter diazotrophicus]|uniref:peptide-methionine (S)-S-oxide reductase n=1 Tax=Pontibacter diazotrophicus TaxID=1400979 RepID=A0A3D8L262_9BACT|nr:peptide-methionine (S)-S-oxide reductase [Pontibacter diazotrophicus]RDV11307.1 hypothetical protein DXT99_25070 [Pontibacter diazotrophicus]